MPNRIDQCFENLKSQGRKAFIAYVTAGDPNLEQSFEVAKTLGNCGVDILELGIPFSDPLADGVVIQQAAQRALDAGANLQKILDHIAIFRRQSQLPLVLFTYYNPVYRMGLEKLVVSAARAGVDGILILDLPPEEAGNATRLMKENGLKQISLIAPTTPPERMEIICRNASGFVYYISREGVTGMQQSVATHLEDRLEEIRRHTALPVAVGFGVSNGEQAAQIAQVADGVVVGSAIVNEVARLGKSDGLLPGLERFVRPIAEAIHASQGAQP